jgi:hypothetical protein
MLIMFTFDRKGNTNSICKKCAYNVKAYGKVSECCQLFSVQLVFIVMLYIMTNFAFNTVCNFTFRL